MDKKCPNCNIHFASSQSLWNHKQRCGRKPRIPTKRSRQDIMGGGVSIPKILDEIINGGVENSSDREKVETSEEETPIKKILWRLNCDEKADLISVDEDLATLFKSLWEDKTTNL